MNSRMNEAKNRNGMTLIELMISIGLVAILCTGMMTLLSTYLDVLQSYTTERNNMMEARMAMEAITDQIETLRAKADYYGYELDATANTIILKNPADGTTERTVLSRDGSAADLKVITAAGPTKGDLTNGTDAFARYITIAAFTKTAGTSVTCVQTNGGGANLGTLLGDSQFIRIEVKADKDPADLGSACTLVTYVYNKFV